MNSSDVVVEVARPPRAVLHALTIFAALSSPWVAATAAPTISGAPPRSVIAAHYYAFQPNAGATSGKTLTFAIANKPAWAQFSTTTGRLQGTPLPANIGTFANVSISVSDGTGRATLAPFSLTVLPLLNSPPKVSGSPSASVVAGQTYAFQPSVTDPNGLRVQFGIWNKPSWAAFDAATGRLSGTPSAANVGTYSNIVIAAYDGYFKGSLPAFSVVVQPAASSSPVSTASGSATLSWVPPTGNTNGTTLTNLAGYRIYYGMTPQLGKSITVANPGLSRYVLTGLAASTWYFAMSAYNSSGVESTLTSVRSLVVN
jgi:putative Ig domain-containing protein